MPKLLSRSKHEEFESNSALQIRNQKERRLENARKLEPVGNLASYEIFAACENVSCILILAHFDFRLTHFLHFTILPFMYKWVLRIFLYFFL